MVLFLCVHNAGRSQMALGFFTAPRRRPRRGLVGRLRTRPSRSTPPRSRRWPSVGIDISGEFPKPWTDEVVRAADVVITMGCGDACPVVPRQPLRGLGARRPRRPDLDAVRPIRDEIERRVRALLAELAAPHSPAAPSRALPAPGPTGRPRPERASPCTWSSIGGSDAGISAALRARELDPSADVTVVVADAYPNFSHLRHPLLRLRRGHPLAQPRPPHRRRPRSHRHAAADWTPRATADRRRRPTAAWSRRHGRRGRARPTTSSSSAPARSRSARRSTACADARRRPTGCTCCTRWATPSPSCAP